MGRPKRAADGGLIYHVLNRANGRMRIFGKEADYAAFEEILAEAVELSEMRLLAYCVLPNHWHLVVWPRGDGELSQFTGWLTLTHTQRWHAHRHSTGSGHVYQGRFKSFPVQDDEHFLTVCRRVDGYHGAAAQPGEHAPPPRTAAEIWKRFLTPFLAQCGTELLCHEPTRKKHWDGWGIVCPDCAVEMIDEHHGDADVRQERDAAFERHWRGIARPFWRSAEWSDEVGSLKTPASRSACRAS